MKKANKNLVERFLIAFAEGNAHVVADMVAAYYIFRGKHFCSDLMWFQLSRKFTWEGLKPTLVAFILGDPYIQQRFPWIRNLTKVISK